MYSVPHGSPSSTYCQEPTLMRASWYLPRPCVQAQSLLRASSAHRPPPPHLLPRSPSSSPGYLPAPSPLSRRHLLTLAIETSCDDTCVAVLEKLPSGAARLHFNEKVTSDNRDFRGVHPLTAVVSHTAHLAPLVRRALRSLPEAPPATASSTSRGEPCARGGGSGNGDGDGREREKEKILWVDGRPRARPDFVAVTRGPGMTSNLATGLNTAKGLAVAWDVPLLGVNHMQAHALTPRLVSALEKGKGGAAAAVAEGGEGEEKEQGDRRRQYDPAFPFLSLLVSGGHTLLVRSESLTSHAVLAQALNIAVGDMMDKCARVILPPEYLDDDRRPSSSSSSSSPPPTGDGLGNVMYGALLEEFVFPGPGPEYGYAPPARRADEIRVFDSGRGWALTPPLSGTTAMAYDFAGFNSQVQRAVEGRAGGGGAMGVEERRLLGRHAMRLAFEHLVSRLLFALRDGGGKRSRNSSSSSDDDRGGGVADRAGMAGGDVRTVVVAGGVASNRYLMHILRAMLAARGYGHLTVVSPPAALCTDNAAMIAWTGIEMYEAGWRSELDILPIRKWPLDSIEES
ncbi:hypothetical protein DL766_002597 [Monosporascus sp. MC13-8B]|uniref:Gcp-like domain-containing protein n=1 Tax=Monosporascus cannonballus TaxID=155416 RepID=A0ABY0GTV6_9PEZI|nr:hypothetical protein DL762_009576 [Monosporascus cannonballus]RYP35254.1 hypothetical protein DL766_002597 [Monosporascus sp. MC13-8B]